MKRWLSLALLIPLAVLAGCGGDSATPSGATTETPSLTADVTLTSPSDGISLVNRTPTFTWSCSESNVTFRIQIANEKSFDRPMVDEKVSTGSYTIATGKLTHDKTYYWRVCAVSGGKTSAWSKIGTFKTVFLG